MRKSHHVIMLHEHSTDTTAWTDLDDHETAEDMEVAVGNFVMHALSVFRDMCLEHEAQPQIQLTTLVLDNENYGKLEHQTWLNEMECLVDDVERGNPD